MRCNCSVQRPEMKLVYVWADPNEGFAFNVFACNECGRLTKNNIWNNAGNTTVLLNGNVLIDEEVVHERS